MIATIEGHLSAIEERAVIIQIGGIGLRVHVPAALLSHCGPVGSVISLHTHLHVREDELTLYGCATEDELRLFELLLTVSGVGPRVGLSLLSELGNDPLRAAIAGEQAEVLSRVPGIGTKTAKKIILELKDKVAFSGDLVPAHAEWVDEDAEVLAALTGLGYSIVEAQTALQHVPATVRGTEERLRAALAYFGA
jgi:Holliday junction DNA helicase RuvA